MRTSVISELKGAFHKDIPLITGDRRFLSSQLFSSHHERFRRNEPQT